MSIARITEIAETQNTAVDASRTIGLQEELFILGYSFVARDVVTSQAVADLYIHLDSTSMTDKQVIFAPLSFVAAEAGPVVVTYYVSPTLTEGGRTAIIGSNRRATSSNTYESTIEFVAPANVTSPGTKFTAQLVASSGSQGGQADIGGVSGTGLPFEIDTTKDYLIKIDNTNGADTLFEYNIPWFEVPV